MYESTVLETHYFSGNGEVTPPVLAVLLIKCQKRKRQLVTLQVGQLSQLSSTSVMTELVRVEVKSCAAVGRKLHDYISLFP